MVVSFVLRFVVVIVGRAGVRRRLFEQPRGARGSNHQAAANPLLEM